MKKTYMTAVLLLAVLLLSFAQTSDEVVSLLNDIDENSRRYKEKIVSIRGIQLRHTQREKLAG
ncbi:MAG: hypothetical protein LBH44_08670 [Treponema sp.]|nr:hypothetical protein [Treponema sp.]